MTPSQTKLMDQCRKEAEAHSIKGLEKEMTQAMADLVGRGYVPDHYRDCASDFIQIAESAAAHAYAQALYSERSKAPTVERVMDLVKEEVNNARSVSKTGIHEDVAFGVAWMGIKSRLTKLFGG